MKLTAYERLVLLNVLPRQGNALTLKLIRDLQAALSFSEEEHAALQFHQEGPTVKWRAEGDIPKEVPIGAKAMSIIAGTLESLNAQNKLGIEHLALYERFCEEQPLSGNGVAPEPIPIRGQV